MNETTQHAHPGQTIRAARVVPATPAEAYQVFTDAASMAAWWGHTGSATLFLCEADVRVGGHYRYGMRSAAGAEDVVNGRFVEIYPGVRLVFTWTWKDGAEVVHDSLVSIEFLDLKDRTTRIVVTHQGLPQPAASRYSALWHDLIQDLTLHLASR